MYSFLFFSETGMLAPPGFSSLSVIYRNTHTKTWTNKGNQTTILVLLFLEKSNLSKDFLIDSEGEVQHVFYVIVLHPLKGLVKLLVQILQVTQVTGTTKRNIKTGTQQAS